VSKKGAPTGTLLARFWAQMKVDELAVFPERNHEELLRLGRDYGLVTPGTSLIVLERLDQYLEHDIRPPASLIDMRETWDNAMAQQREADKEDQEEKLEQILDLWRERVKWWKKKFTYPPNYRHADARNKKMRSARGGGGMGMGGIAGGGGGMGGMSGMGGGAAMGGMATKSEAKEMEKDDAGPPPAPEPEIELQEWDPDTPYLRALKQAGKSKRLTVYLEQKKTFGDSPAYYLDCADFFFKKKQAALALQVLSNVAEMELDNPALLRILAHRLAQLDLLELAATLFDEVLRLRPEEPQSYRDLGLVLARQKKYGRAMELLAHVVMDQWDRFDGIEVIALMELNGIIPRARRAGIKKIPIDKRLIKHLDVDVRIALSWDTDLTDIDVWIIEPSGEKAYYGNQRTRIGGLVTEDFTEGYGPEIYLIRRAMRGKYKVQVNFYGSQAQTLTGAVTIQLELFTNYGRKNQRRKSITVRLSEEAETLTIGAMRF